MSKSRAKGTRWESELKGMLAKVWDRVDRAPLRGIHDHGDFVNVGPWLLEAKAVDSPHFLQWARTCRAKSRMWCVLWKGNRTTPDGQPLGMVSLDTLLYLLHCEKALRITQPDTQGMLYWQHYGTTEESNG